MRIGSGAVGVRKLSDILGASVIAWLCGEYNGEWDSGIGWFVRQPLFAGLVC